MKFFLLEDVDLPMCRCPAARFSIMFATFKLQNFFDIAFVFPSGEFDSREYEEIVLHKSKEKSVKIQNFRFLPSDSFCL